MKEIEKFKFLLNHLEINKDKNKKKKIKRKRELIINLTPDAYTVIKSSPKSKNMKILEHLTKEMWEKATENWYFNVKDVFRTALDIQYTPIVIGKEKYITKTGEEKEKSIYKNIWTQGVCLNFQIGDTFTNKKEDYCITVENARSIQDNGKLDLGYVMFFEYKIKDRKYERINILNKKSGTQLEFLEFLITGNEKIYEKNK